MNACGHHHVGHIGILGVDKKGAEFYQVSLGGSSARDASLGQILGPSFAQEQMADVIDKIIQVYVERRTEEEPFIDTFRRIGIDPFRSAYMQRIIRTARWSTTAGTCCPDATLESVPNSDDVIIPLALWLEHGPARARRRPGVWLDADEEPESIAGDLDRFQVIAVNFPAFTDGRGFSSARLRERYGYKGEIRAIGDVLRDQLFFMRRCGFDAYAIRADRSPEDALASLDDFSEVYQTSVEQPLPLFRRRG